MVGQRIKESRHRNNLTQEELAEGIISRTYLSLIEKERIEYENELSQKFILNMENIGFTKQEAIKYLEGR